MLHIVYTVCLLCHLKHPRHLERDYFSTNVTTLACCKPVFLNKLPRGPPPQNGFKLCQIRQDISDYIFQAMPSSKSQKDWDPLLQFGSTIWSILLLSILTGRILTPLHCIQVMRGACVSPFQSLQFADEEYKYPARQVRYSFLLF